MLKPGDKIVSVDGTPGYAPGLRAQDGPERVKAQMDAIVGHTCEGTPRARLPRVGRPWTSSSCATASCCASTSRRATSACRPTAAAAARRAGDPEGRMLVGLQFGQAPHDFGDARRRGATPATRCGRSRRRPSTRSCKLFYDKEARDQVSGVVGSYEATRQSFEFDTKRAIYILALISLSLGIINLFPFLPLDGGHIFWALAEKLRGKPIPFRVMERAGVVGFMLVIFLFYIGLSNDIGRISSGEGFGVR